MKHELINPFLSKIIPKLRPLTSQMENKGSFVQIDVDFALFHYLVYYVSQFANNVTN